jgi:putative transposase
MDLHKELNTLKKTSFPWMYEASKCAPQEILRDLDDAFANFFAKRAKYPTFKKRSKGIGSFTLTGTIHVGPNWIQLPTIGKVRLFEHGYLPQDTDLDTQDRKTLKKRDKKGRVGSGVTEPAHYLSATVSEHAGHWFVSVQVKEIVANPAPATGAPIGVDVGIKTLAVSSERLVITASTMRCKADAELPHGSIGLRCDTLSLKCPVPCNLTGGIWYAVCGKVGIGVCNIIFVTVSIAQLPNR